MKFFPILLSWWGTGLVLSRRYASHEMPIMVGGLGGFVLGGAGTVALATLVPGETPFTIIRSVVGGLFFLFSGFAVSAIYGRSRPGVVAEGTNIPRRPLIAGVAAALAGLVVGLVAGGRLPLDAGGAGMLQAALLPFSLALIGFAIPVYLARLLPSGFALTRGSFFTLVMALVLFGSSSIQRLDLFSPLTMKVMKFIHDFVHQFFESMLIPDHGFFRIDVWDYIGLLFSNGVGFWGGMILWFAPTMLVILSIHQERLPSVAHIRQGAARRLLLAAGIRSRRIRTLIAASSLLFLLAAVYQSRFPAVEYWDPKPVPVSSTSSGEVVIPMKVENLNLDDGRLHKFLLRQGGREARFFIVKSPAGTLTVDLDACSICKPDGYGQTAGALLCYYCKTLIPIETVGKPGGCNPVPVPFTKVEGGVRIDSQTLLNLWTDTVQATTRVKKRGAP